MKKVFSIMITIIMVIALTAVVANAAEATYVNASFDSFYVDGVLNFGGADGNASSVLDAHNRTVDGTNGTVKEIKLRGWVGFEQEIESFGYQMDDNAPVLNAGWIAPTEPEVQGAGGQYASRFEIPINVEGLTGNHTFVMVVKLAGIDTPVKIDSTLEATGPATPPNTSFTFAGAPGNAGTADASLIIFIVAAAAIALVVLKKKVF